MMQRYIMGLDIGNTNTVVGLFEESSDNEILYHWRTVTHRDRTSDELGIFLLGFLQSAGIQAKSIAGFIYSSVVPSFNPIVERMAQDYFGSTPEKVVFDMPLPIHFSYPRPYEIGADRIVNAVAASSIYGGDLIVVDMGTATTFCQIHGLEYKGGAIAPGLKLSMEALYRNTAQLPPIEFAKPPSGVIGSSTVEAIRSGFYYGWIGLLKEVIAQIRALETRREYRSIGTGGLSAMIQKEETHLFDSVDSLLTLRGLKIIHRYGRTGQA